MEELSGNDSTSIDSSQERKSESWIENAHLVTRNKGKEQSDDYFMIDNEVYLYTDLNNPAHMNFGEAKLLQRIAEMETRLQQVRGIMEIEQTLEFGDTQQFYYR